MESSEYSRVLIELGFTGLEAEIYVSLLRESPSTGYKIAQTLGKPAANTYKALESLQKKGAVIVDDGRSRLCRAIPARELLAQIERRFRETSTRAEDLFSELRRESIDDRVYRLQSRDQVIERCRQMLRKCKRIALLDIFPGPLKELTHDLESAAARGVEVAAKIYRRSSTAGVTLFLEPDGEEVLSHWPGEWLNIVVDDAEFLLAFLDPDGKTVHQSIWSNSGYLSWVYAGALSSELILSGLQKQILDGCSGTELRKSIDKYRRFKPLDTAGYLNMLNRVRNSAPDGS
ncbi:MAG TPA: helix-turn-helix domain-containing protein [Pyrinomonadaceae bacterium]|jgi:sugar-specific transcriptional regulator TrmB|nr:helix-turn-helix domain-containing protein [Pyrinomonadaceae bacterium]